MHRSHRLISTAAKRPQPLNHDGSRPQLRLLSRVRRSARRSGRTTTGATELHVSGTRGTGASALNPTRWHGCRARPRAMRRNARLRLIHGCSVGGEAFGRSNWDGGRHWGALHAPAAVARRLMPALAGDDRVIASGPAVHHFGAAEATWGVPTHSAIMALMRAGSSSCMKWPTPSTTSKRLPAGSSAPG
jgi:hypothetical protein